jgi:hypothetical protein
MQHFLFPHAYLSFFHLYSIYLHYHDEVRIQTNNEAPYDIIFHIFLSCRFRFLPVYWGADKSSGRPGMKQATGTDRRFWVSYILFITVIGGILVLIIYITRLASNKIFSPSNKIYREVERAKDLSAPRYILVCVPSCGRDSAVSIATRYGLDGPGIESWWGWDFTHPSRLALGPAQPPTQRAPGLSRG